MNPLPYIQLAIAIEPAFAALAKDIAALFKSHPQLTPDMVNAFVSAIHQTDAATLATIAADEAAHPNG